MAGSQEFTSMMASSTKEHLVDGVPLRFAPCTVRVLFKFQPTIALCWKALDNLNKDQSKHAGYTDERASSKEGAVETFSRPPTEPSLLQMMTRERQAAIDNLVNAAMSPETQKALGEMVANSLRNEDDKLVRKAGFDPSKPETLFDTTVPILTGMLKGMWEANKVAFGPLAGKVVDTTTARVKSVLDRAGASSDPDSPLPSQNPNPTSVSDSAASSENSSSMPSGSASISPTT